MKNSDNNETINNSLDAMINQVGAALKVALQRQLKSAEFNITTEQLSILTQLQKENGLYQSQIAKKLAKDKGNITRTLDNLEKTELISRNSHENDRRKFKIFITKKGTELLDKAQPLIKENKKLLRTFISKQEEKILMSLLNKVSLYAKETEK